MLKDYDKRLQWIQKCIRFFRFVRSIFKVRFTISLFAKKLMVNTITVFSISPRTHTNLGKNYYLDSKKDLTNREKSPCSSCSMAEIWRVCVCVAVIHDRKVFRFAIMYHRAIFLCFKVSDWGQRLEYNWNCRKFAKRQLISTWQTRLN